ncbi:mechanosensitive ion channel family protein [Haloplasma contractile]|uniref:Mechanosensitive ion channel protein n=1 Tax=Haloplasma contractile SSD-17B TaxID=1033810 RepID=U2DYS2_9MOLU|nr:mechanosensitive ion channel family protein [Haloplasma contractile]ERJ13392.1 Mechanosensitive ion channel protein [Haloplasma contractile SSD-17B]
MNLNAIWDKVLKTLNPENLDVALIFNRLIQVVGIIVASIVIYIFVKIIIRRLFRLRFKKIIRSDSAFIRKRRQTLEKIVLSLWRYFTYFFAFLMILAAFGINIQTILAGAGILGVVFAVGSQQLIQDFLQGFFNVFEDNISVGDYVEIDKVEGNITDIGLRALKIKSFTGEVHIVPNSKIGHVINYSLDNGKALVDIRIDYDIELEQALAVIKEQLSIIKENNSNIITLPYILGVNKLESLGYEIRIMCDTKSETHWGVQRFIRGELLTTLRKSGISISKNQIIIKGNQERNKIMPVTEEV